MNEPIDIKKDKNKNINDETQEEITNDLQSILRKKVLESSFRKGKDITTDYESEENDFEDISPTKYNEQNQRFGTIDLDKEGFN